MDTRLPTVALLAIVAFAYFATGTPSVSAYQLRRHADRTAIQFTHRFGSKSLTIDCSSEHCFIDLSNAREA